jgi:hypothetical protein
VIEEFQQFIQLGVSHFMIRFSDLASLERFGQEVLPKLP